MIDVRSFSSLDELRAQADEIDALVRASPRRSPFQTAAFLANVVANDEVFRARPAPQPLFVAARDGGRLVGFCALRRTRQRTAGAPWTKLEWLLTLEVNRPHLVLRADASPAQRADVAAAVWRHLFDGGGWSMLELSQQDDACELWPPPARALPSTAYARLLPSREGNVLRLIDDGGAPRFPDLDAYVGALARKQRSNVKRACLDLLARPGVSLLTSSDPAAARLLFDLYLDVEKRSWKARGDARIQRSDARVAYYRGLLDARQPMKLQVDVLLDDGVPIAGHVTGDYEGATYFLQTVYDERAEELSPGSLMLLWSVRDCLQRGARCFDMLPDFSYYKSRWLADTVTTSTLQVFRAGTVPWAKALVGEARRRLRPPPPPTLATENASKRAADAVVVPAPPPDRDLAARVLLALEERGVRPIPAAALRAALPFADAVRQRDCTVPTETRPPARASARSHDAERATREMRTSSSTPSTR